jgi:pimeloyl-[acyl-carrier protein] methyl ester esterase
MTTGATLVLLPGLDGTAAMFRPLLASLPAWIRPVVVTYPPAGPNGYDDLLPLVQRAIAVTGRCHVLGWSFGGPLALMAASANPSAVQGIILCASFARAPRPDLVPLRFAFRPPVVAAIRAMRRAPALVSGYPTEDLRRARAETWRQVGARVLSTRTRAALGVDTRRHLASCTAPVLYVAASRDRVVPRRNIDDVRAAARRCEVVTIDGPHLALFTNAAPAAAHIVDFVRRTARPDGLKGGNS